MQKVLLAVIAAAIVTIGLTVNYSTASHEPADKTAGAANSIQEVDDGDGVVLLKETMRVSSTSDLILATSAECSILTSLYTEGGPPPEPDPPAPGDPPPPPPEPVTEMDGAFGQVELWIEVDGHRVPVQSVGAATDDGEVVFCNRAYARSATDNEDPLDGLDTEDDFNRTRTANAFNWMAFNVGDDATYDTVGQNNVVTIELKGRFTRKVEENGVTREGPAARCLEDLDENEATPPTPIPTRPDDDLETYGQTCAEALVGKRSLIVEAVHASTHEQTAPAPGIGN